MTHPVTRDLSHQLGRHVTLVLCTAGGTVLGALPPYDVPVPYWPETADVVAEAHRLFGVWVSVLRLLRTAPGLHLGGPVTYLAEVADAWSPPAALAPWTGPDPVGEQPHRQVWARPGGPAAEVAWARQQLERIGRRLDGPAQQVRTWNLSTLWRLPTVGGAAWLKSTPPFFGHEGALLARLDPAVVPALLAAEGRRVLLDELGGDDRDDASGRELLDMIDLLVGLQVAWSSRLGELLSLGLPDWRTTTFPALAERNIAAAAAVLDPPTRSSLDRLLAGLPDRFAAVADCGVPDTLVHGDFHPGNVRSARPGAAHDLRLLDWGDAGVGHPMLDQAAFLRGRSDPDRAAAQAHWGRLWRKAVPGSEPERAGDLLGPVAALRQAAIYQMFLDRIEPDERVYHRDDPARWLRRAAQRFASGGKST